MFEADEDTPDEDTPESLLLLRTAYAELRRSVDKLPHPLGVVLVRHYGLDGDEPETYAQIAEALGRKTSAIASISHRAHWQLGRLLRGPAPKPTGPLSREELQDLQQIAHGCPPTSFWRDVPVRLSARGLLVKTQEGWSVTERGAYVAHVSLADPFKPYRCQCRGAWAGCPLCGMAYHSHSYSRFYIPLRCSVCRGELEAANEQGPHLHG